MKFINASMMPRLDYFIRGPVVKGESVWMRQCWTDEEPGYGEIDVDGHEIRAQGVKPDVEVIHLLHERGQYAGRDKYDILTDHEAAWSLFHLAYSIFKGEHPNKLIGFYDQWDAIRLSMLDTDIFDSFAPHSKDALRCFDFFMPSAYLNKSLREFAAQVRYQVEWLRSRSRAPIYLCAWHKGKGKGDGYARYLTPVEMDAYLDALQNSGADGVIWWAGRKEGINAMDGEGSTNKALKLKAWNHKWRFGTYANAWAEAFNNYRWD
tara:strand:+ start:80 stop:871 length:792 start_codon:yes stop_codon:yes gene_type:complete